MKSAVHQLAMFGGTPEFTEPLHVGAPNMPDIDLLLADFRRVLESGYLTNNGPRVREFEARVASLTQTKHCIAVCNATTALQIAARAMDLTGEVIMPSFTFIATAHAMEWIGLTPVFADVDPISHTLCPRSVELCLSAETSAIVGVHLWGHCCDVDSLEQIAATRKLRLLFDASHAFGSSMQGTPVGSFGDAEVFSFHATKFVHSAEGGVVTTNDDALADRCRRLRAFGFTGLTEVSDVGINGKMHELSAAVGLQSLSLLPQLFAANQRNRNLYQTRISAIPGLSVTQCVQSESANGQYLVVEVNDDDFGLTRDELVSLLRAEGVFARAYFAPGNHRSQPYCNQLKHHPVPLPVSMHLLRTVLQLPTGQSVGPEQIQTICHLLQYAQANAGDIRRQLDVRSGCPVSHDRDPAEKRSAMREAG